MTTLFTNLKGSLDLLADWEYEETRELLNPVLGADDGGCASRMHPQEVMGDGIMALFGARCRP